MTIFPEGNIGENSKRIKIKNNKNDEGEMCKILFYLIQNKFK